MSDLTTVRTERLLLRVPQPDADPDAPFIAFVVAHNAPSRAVAVRLGLTDHGPRVDASDGTVRHAYADRPLDEERYPRA